MSFAKVLQTTVVGLALALPFATALPQGYEYVEPYANSSTTSCTRMAATAYSTGTVIASPTGGIYTNHTQNGTTPDTCRSGNRYTVVPGDNCQAISIAKSVGTRELTLINNILPDCTNLIADVSICLPGVCKTYVVQAGDTCTSIAESQGTTFDDIRSFNPTLDAVCGNLIGGESLCVSAPEGGVSTPPTPSSPTVSPTVSPTGTNATASAGPTASGTPSDCSQLYTAIPGDFCSKIADQFTLSLEQFLQLNPSLNAECTNLLAGVAYCVEGAVTVMTETITLSPVSSPTPAP